MALRWFVHSACHVIGYPSEQSKQNIDGYPNGEVKCLKGTKEVDDHDYPSSGFQMPLHYPRYTKQDYERMEEWKLDLLLKQYGLSFKGTLDEKRAFAMGTFLWPDQY
ncbi:hypothetical protein SESBI_08758 [Sesbania bispinosa]|nr:hypothetical protein SESBI_08758 [Sesbania bispinosa]